MPVRTRTRAASVSSAVPSRQLPRCAPGPRAPRPQRVWRARPRPRGPRGARCQGSTPPRGRRDPGRGLPTAPARRLAVGGGGGGGARAAAPLKFESHYQQVRSPETPDPPVKMFSPEGGKAGGGDAGPGALRRPQDPRPKPAVAQGPRQGVSGRDARWWRRSAVLRVLNYLSCVCIFVGEVCAPEFFFVWKILCVINVVIGGKIHFFFLVLKLKT